MAYFGTGKKSNKSRKQRLARTKSDVHHCQSPILISIEQQNVAVQLLE
jgi:hypothetical protein